MASLGAYTSVELFQVIVPLKSTPKQYRFYIYRAQAYTQIQPKDQGQLSFLVFDWDQAEVSNPTELPRCETYKVSDKVLANAIVKALHDGLEELVAEFRAVSLHSVESEAADKLPEFPPRKKTLAKTRTGKGGIAQFLAENFD